MALDVLMTVLRYTDECTSFPGFGSSYLSNFKSKNKVHISRCAVAMNAPPETANVGILLETRHIRESGSQTLLDGREP
jgi:hypothetical protein